MYLGFYGLKEAPFNITSSSQFFFRSKNHNQALSTILYGINERKGIILLTGEVGTGKTTLCRVLLNEISQSSKTSLILNPYFNPTQLLKAVLEDFGIQSGNTRLDMVSSLNRFLIKTAQSNLNAVLIVDEAQNLTAKQLEQLRLLSNLETDDCKLLQIVLAGQPELKNKLELHPLRQIKQRISVKYHILPLEPHEIREYIYFRLGKVRGTVQFTEDAYKTIYDFSQGIPRLINMLCDRALLAGFVKEKFIIDQEIIRDCLKELR